MSKNVPCFSTKIDPSLKDKLLSDLKEQGFIISHPAHTFFSASKKGISCTLYLSGSLTVQGKGKEEFIEYYLEPEILKDFSYTHPTAELDFTPRIGCDEAGKGDFFGPLCAVSLFADEKGIEALSKLGVKDSKLFSDEKIERLAKEIKKHCRHYVMKLNPEKYNELYAKFKNLNRLLGWLHATAIENLVQKTGCKKVIIDQFAKDFLMEEMIKQKKLEIDLTQRIKGEADIVVAAASILARDAFLQELKNLSSSLGFSLPKGASKEVIRVGKQIFLKGGLQTLDSLSKSHFKTRNDVIS